MHFREGVGLALLQLRQEKLKSVFSVIGVVLGVMFLTVVVGVVAGMDRYIEEDFATQVYGINTVQVRSSPAVQVSMTREAGRALQRRPPPTVGDADAIRRGLSVPGRVGVESSLSATELRTDEGGRAEGVRLSAISPEILEIRTLRVERGRPFSPQEAARGVPVAILGIAVAEALFPDADPIGERVRIRGFPYRVVGVLEDQGTILGIQLNNRVLVPALSRAGRILPGRDQVSAIVVQVDDPRHLATARLDVEASLRAHRRLHPAEENDFALETAEESLAFWDTISRVLYVALPGLVGISLIVGGIVIMNIMLVSVIERTREIGIRKALGARRSDIIGQFLVEATTLSVFGALLGVALGTGLAALVRLLTPLPAVVAPGWVGIGVLLGVSVGIAAGVYPAIRASALDPVDALRHE
jgi:putative ABC transport system permease protein